MFQQSTPDLDNQELTKTHQVRVKVNPQFMAEIDTWPRIYGST